MSDSISLRPFVALAALLLVPGCGGKGTYPVEGKIVYSDGTAQTNPSVIQVKAKLAELEG